MVDYNIEKIDNEIKDLVKHTCTYCIHKSIRKEWIKNNWKCPFCNQVFGGYWKGQEYIKMNHKKILERMK